MRASVADQPLRCVPRPALPALRHPHYPVVDTTGATSLSERQDGRVCTYVHGVSTRAVDDLVRAMGGSGVSKSQVSRLCAEIDERVQAFLTRPIEDRWPYLWLDATYLKVRENGRIVSRAVIVAVGVNLDGRPISLLRPFFAYYGEGDVAPDGAQTALLKPPQIRDARGTFRYARQLFIPSIYKHSDGWRDLQEDVPVDAHLTRIVRQYQSGPLGFET